ncbi:MAG TPA: methylated-DNA--[protein]-cysteine S-methyltransferase [Acidobacteriota bacterium]
MYYQFIQTPLGPMLAAGDRTSLRYLEFAHEKKEGGTLKDLEKQFQLEDLKEAGYPFDALFRQLQGYFEGRVKQFDLRLAPLGTDFQRSVWNQLRTIAYGETRTYGQIAASLGEPSKARAVGAAVGRNPIAIIIPCHRVVGHDGGLTGYGGGLDRKAKLLELEQARK